MCRNIYMIRHGETLFNVQGRTQGWSDSPLTDLGIEQAEEARKYFEKQMLKFDAYFSSTAERACDTMEILFPRTPYRRLKGLKEQNFGAFEGQPQYLEPDIPKRESFFVEFGGESWQKLTERLKDTLTSIFEENKDYQSILCVSHGAAISTLMKSVSTDEQIKKMHGINNLDMIHFTFNVLSGELKAIKKIHTLSN
ncbi:histidine phosphatase family protein [Pseudolactococcus insecticola]|uniref:Phosphoglycerate mutase n=1 Tax=Pseudolactococcus insecticola TaxID=2709158 RepID=A0A6A0B384_9LACT|nr:histidine phosphatase family protein [Lactococcus insecticola]GFH39780.1 phosphoglycerate mutase [Lactococcus insecticola]